MTENSTDVKPGKIHNTSYTKLGRRGLMKKLAGFGFSSAAVASLTTDDVKAAASDQVPITVRSRLV